MQEFAVITHDFLYPEGHECWTGTQPDVGSEFSQEMSIGSRYAAVGNVADDRHLQVIQAALALPDREGVGM